MISRSRCWLLSHLRTKRGGSAAMLEKNSWRALASRSRATVRASRRSMCASERRLCSVAGVWYSEDSAAAGYGDGSVSENAYTVGGEVGESSVGAMKPGSTRIVYGKMMGGRGWSSGCTTSCRRGSSSVSWLKI